MEGRLLLETISSSGGHRSPGRKACRRRPGGSERGPQPGHPDTYGMPDGGQCRRRPADGVSIDVALAARPYEQVLHTAESSMSIESLRFRPADEQQLLLLDVESDAGSGTARILISGDMDGVSAGQLRDVFTDAVRRHRPAHVQMDLRGVPKPAGTSRPEAIRRPSWPAAAGASTKEGRTDSRPA
jgi:hypothetical protein